MHKPLLILQSEGDTYLTCVLRNRLETRMIPFLAGCCAFSSLKQKSFKAATSEPAVVYTGCLLTVGFFKIIFKIC